MIKLIDRGPQDSLIYFGPRPQVKAPELKCELLHGHKCPVCNNIIQALFLTKTKVNLSLYEETRVLNQSDGRNDGMLTKIIPNKNEPESGYHTSFLHTPKASAQWIRLKNHLINWRGARSESNDRSEYFEPGERCCRFTAIFPISDLQAIEELGIVCGFVPEKYSRTPPRMPSSFLDEYNGREIYYNQLDARTVPAMGQANPIVMVDRNVVKSSGNDGFFIRLIDAWEKKEAERDQIE